MWPELRTEIRPFVARRVPAADVQDVVQDVRVRVQLGLPACVTRPVCAQAEPEEPDEGERQCMARYLVAQVAVLPAMYRTPWC